MKSDNHDSQSEEALKVAFAGIFVLFCLLAILWMVHANSLSAFGDAFNGIAGPFVALLAAYLMWKTLTAQIQANDAIKKIEENRTNEEGRLNRLRIAESYQLKIQRVADNIALHGFGTLRGLYAFKETLKNAISREEISDHLIAEMCDLIGLLDLLSATLNRMKDDKLLDYEELLYINMFFLDSLDNQSKYLFRYLSSINDNSLFKKTEEFSVLMKRLETVCILIADLSKK